MKRSAFAIQSCLIILLGGYLAFGCTTFCLKGKGEILFGRNYDYDIGDGLVLVNKRGMRKVSTTEDEGNPAKWTSKYGSVTFNQFGRENPTGGMNEKGLVVELMWLQETQYPKADKRPTLDVLEWIQYQLDTAATADEVVRNTADIRVNSDIKLHYLVNDVEGHSATIEYIDGKLVAHSGQDLPISTLTNNTYDKSLEFLKTTELEKAKTDSSLDRFARAAQKTKEFEKKPKTDHDAVNYAFEVLADVSQKNLTTTKTYWSIVYDQKRGKIYFRTLQSPSIKHVDAKSFDYACPTAVKMYDVNSRETGDVTGKFVDYTRKANRDLIELSFNGTDFLKAIPKVYRDLAASYPEEFVCVAKDPKAAN